MTQPQSHALGDKEISMKMNEEAIVMHFFTVPKFKISWKKQLNLMKSLKILDFSTFVLF